ncbi:hypothetical protein [Acidovorax sp. M2(2025)]|uniref:hypothetical protein n=1 Tax=Acidovorax sp. M2(2025) TaxID=3411355 RepID=UPI003BF48368
MSNIKAYREAYYGYSGKLSDNVRTLALASVAIVWTFKVDNKSGGVTLHADLYWALLLAMLAMASDLLQYFYGSIAWGIYTWRKEREGVGIEAPLVAPSAINWPTNIFFYAKVVFLAGAYGLIIRFLIGKIQY